MPTIKLIFFQDERGSVPLIEWLETLPKKARAKCIVRLQRLAELGHKLRRPEADYLRDGIYELRVRLQGINYRMLYFFSGQIAAVVSHGLIKERVVPSQDIERAIERKGMYELTPAKHMYETEL